MVQKIEYNYKKFKRELNQAWFILIAGIFVFYIGFMYLVYLAGGLSNGMMQFAALFSFFGLFLIVVVLIACAELVLLRKLREIELKNELERR